MKVNGYKLWLIGAMLTGSAFFSGRPAQAVLTTNSWSDGFGKWEIGANWSAGVPSLANAQNVVAGGFPIGSRTITIDVDTVSSNVINGWLTISNLTVGGTVFAPA